MRALISLLEIILACKECPHENQSGYFNGYGETDIFCDDCGEQL